MLEHAGFRYSDKGKSARHCTPVAAPWSYDNRTLMMPFIARSVQPDKVVKLIPALPRDFIESHAKWSQYGSEDVRTHLLRTVRKGYQMFSNYGQLAEELKVFLGKTDLSLDEPMTSTKLTSSHRLLFCENPCHIQSKNVRFGRT
jgi:hypothetical protein